MKRLLRATRVPVRWIYHHKLLAFALGMLGIALLLQLLKYGDLANLILIITSCIALIPITIAIIADVRSGRYGTDWLPAIGIVSALFLQQFVVALLIVITLYLTKMIEAFALRRGQRELRSLLKCAPPFARTVHKGKEAEVAANGLREHDTIVVRPYEIVPADAIIISGTSTFDESQLTGAQPATRTVGETILCASINSDNVIMAQVLRPFADSQYQQSVRLLNAAGEHPAPLVRLANLYGLLFMVLVLTTAGIAWILSQQPIHFLEVLVVATPCALITVPTIALLAAINRARQNGILIKTGAAFEMLARLRTIVFSKNGALTISAPELEHVIAFKPYNKDNVLAWAAAVEQQSGHALAVTVRSAAVSKSLKLPKIKHVRELVGHGIEAHAQGKDILLGQLAWLEERGVSSAKIGEQPQQTAIYLAIDGTLAGYLTFRDEFQPDAKGIVKFFQKPGVKKLLLLTGDASGAAQALAKALHIKDIVAAALPADKLRTIESLSNRPTAYVGDGTHDAPLLMAADVGIALGARGDATASEPADVVIIPANLLQVAQAVALARHAFRVVTVNIVLGLIVSVILILMFAITTPPLVIGLLSQLILNAALILSTLRAHRLPTQLLQ